MPVKELTGLTRVLRGTGCRCRAFRWWKIVSWGLLLSKAKKLLPCCKAGKQRELLGNGIFVKEQFYAIICHSTMGSQWIELFSILIIGMILRGGMVSSTTKKSVLDTATQKLVESQVWRSIFRHGYPDTPLNQSLVMMGNVFLHLHPVKVSRQAMR